MNKVIIYHNLKCSKSRQTLALIQKKGLQPIIIDYLQTPPKLGELKQILKQLKCRPREIIRPNEPAYQANHLENPNISDDKLLQAIVNDPILLQRPIVIHKGKAVIGRPPENVLEIL